MAKISSALALAFFLSACATGQGFREKSPLGLQRVFHEERGEVWEALQLVFQKYPKKIVEEEAGLVETAPLRYGQLYPPPPLREKGKRAWRYVLKVSLAEKGDPESPLSQVLIQKTIQSQKDFFSPLREQPSDFLEEEALMYRLRRELQIKKLVKKLYE